MGLAVAGNGSGTVTLTGAIADINRSLNGLRYVPSPGFSGTDTLTASTNDLGPGGAGGPQSDSHATTITVVGRPSLAGSLLAPSAGPLAAAIPAPYSGVVTGGAVPGSGGTAGASNGPVPVGPGDEFWRLYGATPGPRPADRPGELGYLDGDLGGAIDVLDPAQFLDRRGTTSKP